MNVLSHPDRSDKVIVFSLDKVLLADIRERLSDSNFGPETETVFPDIDSGRINLEQLDNLAKQTTGCRLIIMDVRTSTLPTLQAVYSRISGYNRSDFNRYCHTMLIGDMPGGPPVGKQSMDNIASYAAKMRNDYSPGVFFYDPLIHYDYEDQEHLGIDHKKEISDRLPAWLQGGFNDKDVNVRQVRAYFRAAMTDRETLAARKERRLKKLASLYDKTINYGSVNENRDFTANSYEGLAITGEMLAVNIYPFYFETWAGELMKRSRKGWKCA